eukprot:gene12399-6066_t
MTMNWNEYSDYYSEGQRVYLYSEEKQLIAEGKFNNYIPSNIIDGKYYLCQVYVCCIVNQKLANSFKFEMDEDSSFFMSMPIKKHNTITIPLNQISSKKIRTRDENIDKSNKTTKREIATFQNPFFSNLKLN